MTGKVYLVGAGPGAADLLTLRAVSVLSRADVVLHDALVDPAALAFAPHARKLNVGKRAGRPSTDQAFINRLIVRLAQRSDVVVRLKGGDPLLFGRAQEEIDACRASGVSVEIIPGVSAAFAAAAEAQASLTQRGLARSVTFVTPAVGRGEAGDGAWAHAAAAADTAALYMGKAHAAAVRDALLAAGRAPGTPTLLCEAAGRPNARRLGGDLARLPELAAQAGDGPALLLIGEALREAVTQNWSLSAPVAAVRS